MEHEYLGESMGNLSPEAKRILDENPKAVAIYLYFGRDGEMVGSEAEAEKCIFAIVEGVDEEYLTLLHKNGPIIINKRIYKDTGYPDLNHYFRGVYLDTHGRNEEAALEYRTALGYNSNSLQVPIRLSIVNAELGKLGDAISCLIDYLEKYPTNTDSWCQSEDDPMRIKNVIINLEGYVNGGGYANGWIAIGFLYMLLKEPKNAIKAYLESVRLDGNNGLALHCLALSYWSNHEHDLAIELLTRAEQIKPTDSKIKHHMAMLYHKKALEKVEQASEVDPENQWIHLELASEYDRAHTGQEKILSELSKAIGNHSGYNTQAYYKIGRKYMDMGEFSKAIKAFQNSIECDFQYYGETHYLLAHCYLGIGDVSSAIRELKIVNKNELNYKESEKMLRGLSRL